MKILSIDVGMKNLAYCLLNVSETNNYDIIDWNVVNLTDSDKYVCKCLKKNNKVCGKKAKYFKNANYQSINLLTLPIHQYLNKNQISYIAKKIKEFYNN